VIENDVILDNLNTIIYYLLYSYDYNVII
jgi:hypothetical protein